MFFGIELTNMFSKTVIFGLLPINPCGNLSEVEPIRNIMVYATNHVKFMFDQTLSLKPFVAKLIRLGCLMILPCL